MSILVVGLGKLGLPIASLLSKRSGHDVYGWDTNEEYREALLDGTFETSEPDCDYSRVRVIRTSRGILDILADVDFVSICVNTPSNPDSSMDLSQIESAVRLLSNRVTSLDLPGRLPVVINSTIMPGTCEWLTEQFPKIHIMSNPVWIAIGSVIKDLQNPPGFVIGCDCEKGSVGTDQFSSACGHNRILGTWLRVIGKPLNPVITNTKTAEFIKLYHNQWCTVKMSSIGWVGDHATELGINIGDVSWFMMNGGERPGKFWNYGPPYGGSCFPRDLEFYQQAVSGLLSSHGVLTEDMIATGASTINCRRLYEIALELESYKTIAILGRSYKYEVSVMEASFALSFAELLESQGKTVWAVDSLDEIPKDKVESIEVWVIHHQQLANQVPSGANVINLWRQR